MPLPSIIFPEVSSPFTPNPSILYDGNSVFYAGRKLADQVPFAEEVNYLPSWIFEGINPWEMETKSLIEIMETQFGVKIAYSMQTLKAKVPTKEQKEILNLTSNAPHLSIRSKVYDKSGKVVKYTKVFFRTDIVEYSFVWTV